MIRFFLLISFNIFKIYSLRLVSLIGVPGDDGDLPGDDGDLPGDDSDLPGDDSDLGVTGVPIASDILLINSVNFCCVASKIFPLDSVIIFSLAIFIASLILSNIC